ncbi:MAG TPA: FAD-dependent oxidoreductase [Phycisphaerae bacterium]|nr:FAD-dependent oxidoreductase [Phycisphaerae bacterium]
MEESDVLILGAGLTGMSAASVLQDRAVVLEQSDRPGGLVRTECFDGYWFDRVLHLLYTDEPDVEARIRQLLGDDLAPCSPVSWVHTDHGTARFPFQFHLGDIAPEKAINCLMELAQLAFQPRSNAGPANFEEMLLQTFGKTMCEVFHFPYNRKVWKRPLHRLTPQGFTWNIAPVELRKALVGALSPEKRFAGYNSRGWYPRPPADSPVRGMELLSRRLARKVPDLRLGHTVTALDLAERTVTVACNGETYRIRYDTGCCSTIPLPLLMRICRQTPRKYQEAARRLTRNRVLTVALNVKGPRPHDSGHWRYYANESLAFTRLIYPHQFDPLSAPPEGWGLMAEIVEPGELPLRGKREVLDRVREDARRAGALPDDCQIVGENLIVTDPAYVVFSVENQRLLNNIRSFFERRGITLMGRYGRWSYTSMAQVMGRGFRWAEGLCESPRLVGTPQPEEGLYVPASVGQVAEEA